MQTSLNLLFTTAIRRIGSWLKTNATPSSVAIRKGGDPVSSTVYSDEGTIMHALAAMILRDWQVNGDKCVPAAGYVGRMLEAEDYEHATLSPSGAPRWMHCVGSFTLENRGAFEPRKYSMAITAEMAEHVQTYVDHVIEYASAPGATLYVEQRLSYGHLTGETGATGSGDAIIILPGEIQAHDAKFGYRDVSPEESEQCMSYGLGVLEDFDVLLDPMPTVFRAVIHQPRVQHAPKEWTCSIEHLQGFAHKVRAQAGLAHHAKEMSIKWLSKGGAPKDWTPSLWGDTYLTPGEKQCQFCDAAGECPALRDAVLNASLADYDETIVDPSEVVVATPPADVAKLGLALALAPMVETWLKAIRARAERVLYDAENDIEVCKVLGFELGKSKDGNRSWVDEAATIKLLKGARYKNEQIYKMDLLGPAPIEKLLKSKPKVWAKLNTIALIERKPGGVGVYKFGEAKQRHEFSTAEDDYAVDVSVDDLL